MEIDCQTAYPIDGDVRMTLKKAPRKATALRIRIPGWAVGNPVPTSLYTYIDKGSAQPLIFINGSEIACECEKGYAVLDRKWKDGDEVEIRFEEHEKTAGIVTLTDTDRSIDFIPYYRHAQDVPTQMSVWVNANR